MKKQIGAMDFSNIEKAIVTVKGQNVIIDSDVAKIYGVETREVNQAIKNNPDKFPVGYIVEADKDELIKNFDKFKNIKNYPGTPKVFTEKVPYSFGRPKNLLAFSQSCAAAASGSISSIFARHKPVSGRYLGILRLPFCPVGTINGLSDSIRMRSMGSSGIVSWRLRAFL